MGLNVGELLVTMDLRDRVTSGVANVVARLRAASPVFRTVMDGMASAAASMSDTVVGALQDIAVKVGDMVLSAALSGTRVGELLQSLGGLPGVISKVSGAANTFSTAMGVMGSAARWMADDTNSSMLKVIVVIGLVIAAVIVLRKVLTGQMSAARAALLGFSPAAFVFQAAMNVIGKAAAAVRGRVVDAFQVASARVRQFWADAEQARDGISSAYQQIMKTVTTIRRIGTVWQATTGLIRTSNMVVRGTLAGMSTAMLSFGQAALTATPMVLGAANKSAMALAGIGVAGVAVGGLFAGVFAAITAGIAAIGIKAALESEKVQAAFADLKSSAGDDLAEAASVLEGPLTQAAGSLKTMFSTQIAPALRQMFTDIAPLIGQFTAGLGQMLVPLLPAIQGVVAATSPMLAALAGSLGQFGSQLAGFLTPVAQALSQNSGLLAALVTGIGGVLQALAPLLAALVQVAGAVTGPLMSGLALLGQTLSGQLGPVLTELGPVIGLLVTNFANLAAALIPLLPPVLQLVAALATSLAPVLTQVAQALTTALAPVLNQLRPVITQLGLAFGQLVMAFVPLLAPIAQLVGQLATALLPAISPLLPIVGEIASALGGVLVQAITILVGAITPLLPPISQMAALFGQAIMEAITALSPIVIQLATVIGTLVSALAPLLPPLMQLATALLTPIVELIKALSPILLGLANILTQVVAAVTPFLPPLIQLGSSILPLVMSLVAALAKVLQGDFKGALEVIKRAVQTFGETITGAFKKLWTLGGDLVDGIKNTFQKGWEKFMELVRGLAQGVVDTVKGIFGIDSPSKVFAEIGRQNIVGLVRGMQSQRASLGKAAASVADVARQAVATTMNRLGMAMPGQVAGMAAKATGLVGTAATQLVDAQAVPYRAQGGTYHQTIINQTVNYPVAEPTSKVTNRGLQLASSLGL